MEDEFRLKILLFAIFFQILDNLFFPNPRTSHVTSHIHIDNNFQKNTTNLLIKYHPKKIIFNATFNSTSIVRDGLWRENNFGLYIKTFDVDN